MQLQMDVDTKGGKSRNITWITLPAFLAKVQFSVNLNFVFCNVLATAFNFSREGNFSLGYELCNDKQDNIVRWVNKSP